MATYIYLEDSSTQVWQIGVTDEGRFISTEVDAVPSSPLLNDPTNATTWLIGVDTNGTPMATAQSLSVAPTEITLFSPSNIRFSVQIETYGELYTAFAVGGTYEIDDYGLSYI